MTIKMTLIFAINLANFSSNTGCHASDLGNASQPPSSSGSGSSPVPHEGSPSSTIKSLQMSTGLRDGDALLPKGAIQGLAERRFDELQIFYGSGYPSRSTPKVVALAKQFVVEFNEKVDKLNRADPKRTSQLAALQRSFSLLSRKEGLIR